MTNAGAVGGRGIARPPFEQVEEAAPEGYAEWFEALKRRVRSARFRAARTANAEVLRLYWSTGRDILVRQRDDGWGARVIDRIARDMRREFSDQRGWSKTNLYAMRKAAEAWPTEEEFVHHTGGQLLWRHVVVLLDRLNTREDRDWYAARALAEGWRRGLLEHFIKADLKRQIGSAPTNFAAVLEDPDSELAQQLTKDPYVFEHLAFVERVTERDVERALMDRLQDTLLEFGRGMAFVGKQVRFAVTDENGRTDELVLDLLLFSTSQSRYVVVELKVDDFQPAFLGQVAAYVGAVDYYLRDPEKHAPTIGILLCTGKNEAVVRFTLANVSAALGVAGYEGLPEDVKATLPSAAELRAVVDEELAGRRTSIGGCGQSGEA
ncbi:MAG: PDDEXK nuclease domain-containing protein [Propionibacteriaceae bacterium]|jgi:predicted nuclease of restriction endonuclease-like (RecB) superfamily|nr:PDDEXK nuclease domain-containing protein [Propionibacteriaceae bacterium]